MDLTLLFMPITYLEPHIPLKEVAKNILSNSRSKGR